MPTFIYYQTNLCLSNGSGAAVMSRPYLDDGLGICNKKCCSRRGRRVAGGGGGKRRRAGMIQ